MDNYITAVEEIFGKPYRQDTYFSFRTADFKYKGITVTLQEYETYVNIFTSKRRAGAITTEKEFWVFRIDEKNIDSAIRSIVRFWAKNGVKLGGEGK